MTPPVNDRPPAGTGGQSSKAVSDAKREANPTLFDDHGIDNVALIGSHRCPRCRQFKPADQFSPHQWQRAAGYCLKCQRAGNHVFDQWAGAVAGSYGPGAS